MPSTSDNLVTTIRLYLGGRLVLVVALLAYLATGMVALGESGMLGYGASVVLISLTTLVLMAVRSRSDAARKTVLWVSLPIDLAALVLLATAIHAYEDPAYPLFIGLSAAYAAFSRMEGRWVAVSLAVAAAYILSHVIVDSPFEAAQLAFHVLKAAAIVFLSYAINAGLRRRLQREDEVRRAHRDVEQLNANLERRLTELEAVYHISELIHSSLDFESVGPTVIDIVQKVVDIPASSLFVIDKTSAETLFSASRGTERHYVQPGQVTVVDDDGVAHFSCGPILDRDDVMVVFCAAPDEIERMSREDRMVLQTIASELVVAVENSRLYKLTKRMAVTDELTNLYNYRYLQQRLDEEVERARRYGKSLSLLMIDVDDFKRYNDTHGHIAGDRALAGLGRVLRSQVREVDVVARYGGEEFSILLPETDETGGFVAAEKIREAVSGHAFSTLAEPEGQDRLTVSIGLATYPAHAAEKEGLLQQADEALYQAKSGGKNRVKTPRMSGARLRAAEGEAG